MYPKNARVYIYICLPKLVCIHAEREWEKENKKLTTALKRVDLPTLGRPTIPAFKLMLNPEAENRLLIPKRPIKRDLSANWFWFANNDDLVGIALKAVIKLLRAIIAISSFFLSHTESIMFSKTNSCDSRRERGFYLLTPEGKEGHRFAVFGFWRLGKNAGFRSGYRTIKLIIHIYPNPI